MQRINQISPAENWWVLFRFLREGVCTGDGRYERVVCWALGQWSDGTTTVVPLCDRGSGELVEAKVVYEETGEVFGLFFSTENLANIDPAFNESGGLTIDSLPVGTY